MSGDLHGRVAAYLSGHPAASVTEVQEHVRARRCDVLCAVQAVRGSGDTSSALASPRNRFPSPGGLGSFEIVGLGLRPRDGVLPDFEGYQSAVHALAAIERYRQFWLGDLLNIGEAAFGELAAQVESEVGLDYKTLANYRWVARCVPVSRRRENVSWSKHAEVAPLDSAEQVRLLDQAEAEGWTVRELRSAARGELPAPEQPSWTTPDLHDGAAAVVNASIATGDGYLVPGTLLDELRAALGLNPVPFWRKGMDEAMLAAGGGIEIEVLISRTAPLVPSELAVRAIGRTAIRKGDDLPALVVESARRLIRESLDEAVRGGAYERIDERVRLRRSP